MTLEIKINHVGLVPKISRSQIRKLKKGTLSILGHTWHKKYVPGKFRSGAAQKYKYALRRTKNVRTGKVYPWAARKYPEMTSGQPLVWTGRSRQLSRTRTLQANSKRVYIKMPIRAFNFRPRGINMRREFLRILKSEERALGKQGERWIRSLFSKKKKNIRVIT